MKKTNENQECPPVCIAVQANICVHAVQGIKNVSYFLVGVPLSVNRDFAIFGFEWM